MIFLPGSLQEKLQTMFYMYDIDGTGHMSMKQIGQMFRSDSSCIILFYFIDHLSILFFCFLPFLYWFVSVLHSTTVF